MTFPEKLSDREKFIEEQVVAGNFEAKWTELSYSHMDKNIKLLVMEDALKVEGIRVNVSARLAQRLADMFYASLPTAMVVDLMFIHAVRKANPCPQPISSTVAAMKKHSDSIEKQIGSSRGLAAPVGKHWILDKKMEPAKTGTSCNYGWHFTGSTFQGIKGFPAASSLAGSNVKVIQPNATAHDMLHSDYSQTCQLVSQQCWVDGVEKRFSDLLSDPVLAGLVSHQGVLKFNRQPGVDPVVGQVVLFPVIVNVDDAIS